MEGGNQDNGYISAEEEEINSVLLGTDRDLEAGELVNIVHSCGGAVGAMAESIGLALYATGIDTLEAAAEITVEEVKESVDGSVTVKGEAESKDPISMALYGCLTLQW